MNKLLTLTILLVLFATNYSVQTQDYQEAFSQIYKSSVLVRFRAIYEDRFTDPKTGKIITKARIKSFRGSGTIVGKKSNKEGPHEYYVLTSRHILIPHHDLLDNPIDDLNKAKSIDIVVARYQYEGTNSITVHPVSGYWIMPVEDPNLDFAILRFKSSENIPVAKICRKLPRDLFGKTSLTVAAASGIVPVPVVLYLGSNKPAPSAQFYHVAFSGPCTFGMSGSGIFIYHQGSWKLAGILEARYGDGGSFGFIIRVDVILAQLQIGQKQYWLEEK